MDRLYMAAKSISNDVRRKSASGGIFFELAKLVLDENGIVYGAAFTESWEVQHIRVSKEEELPKLQGSKYPQSTIVTVLADIKKDLNEGRRVLFCGTPCQANAVLAYVGYSNRDKCKGQILRSTPNTAPLICGACNTQPEGLSTMA